MGAIIVDDRQKNETYQCVHCNAHFRIIPRSGYKRGFCRNCMGPTCKKNTCETHCQPWEKQMEEMERHFRKKL